jgi:hypothetical protein
MADCPKCATPVNFVNIEDVEVRSIGGPAWRGLAYSCPNCSVLLSVGIDPISLKADTITGTVAAVADYLRRTQ